MVMKLSFVLLTRILVVKKPKRLYDDVFSYIEGGDLLNIN
jgi:hypothetical protein